MPKSKKGKGFIYLSPLQQKMVDALKAYEGMPNDEKTNNMIKNTVFRVLKQDEEYSEMLVMNMLKLYQQVKERKVEDEL